MMKLSDELIQGFALGEAALSEHADEVFRVLAMKEDEEWMGTTIPGLEKLWQDYLNEWQVYVNEHFATGDGAPKADARQEEGVKARFRELLAQHPELTRPQAYAQAVMEITEPAIEEATMMGIPVVRSGAPQEVDPVLKLGSLNDYIDTGPTITLPACVSREDCERIKAEIQAVLDWAERRGERKAMAFLMGEGSGPPLGVVEQEDGTIKGRYPGKNYAEQFTANNLPGAPLQVKERLAELLDTHPELTRGSAFIQAMMEADEPVIAKARIGNLDGWQYCTMKVTSDDDEKTNLD